jgi:hypothetical protein
MRWRSARPNLARRNPHCLVDRKPDRLELLGDLDHERGREERIDRVELRCHAEPEMLLG